MQIVSTPMSKPVFLEIKKNISYVSWNFTQKAKL